MCSAAWLLIQLSGMSWSSATAAAASITSAGISAVATSASCVERLSNKAPIATLPMT